MCVACTWGSLLAPSHVPLPFHHPGSRSQVHHLIVNDKQGAPVTLFDERQWTAFVGHYKDDKGALPTTLSRLVLG